MEVKPKVDVVEIGPRDGFQNVAEFIPTGFKIQIIERLYAAGFERMQITSFVSPKAIPQLSDARQVTEAVLDSCPDNRFFALVPNLVGAKAAWDAGLREVSHVLSLSEAHNKANVGKTVEQSVNEVRRIREELPELNVIQDIGTTFGCPYAGKMEIGALVDLIGILTEIGTEEFVLCDTIGVATPGQVKKVFETVREAFPAVRFAAHIHDTRNMGILNTYTAIQQGASSVQSSIGGLGGCPFAPGASGNTSTEDLVYMLEADGYDTGINFSMLLKTAQDLRKNVEGQYSGHHINITVNTPCF
jgi:hydroxymethylglutaryl-CoA lyase